MVQWEVPPTRRVAFVVVLLVAAAGVLVTRENFKAGGYLLAGALLLAAVLRATLPEKYCLGLLVRSRRLDVVMNAGLALALFVGTNIIPVS